MGEWGPCESGAPMKTLIHARRVTIASELMNARAVVAKIVVIVVVIATAIWRLRVLRPPKFASLSGKISKFFQLHAWDAKLLRLTYFPILRAFLLGRKELTAIF